MPDLLSHKQRDNAGTSQSGQSLSPAAKPGRKGVVLPFRSRRRQPDSLPVVDIDGLDHANPSVRRRTAARITEIAMDNGFLYLRSHGVSNQLLDAVYEQARHFFALEQQQKDSLYIGNSSNHRGYVPITEKGDYADEGPRRYEAFDMGVDLPADDPDYLARNPLLGPNIWPDQPGFKYILGEYFRELQRVGELMFRGFEIGLGLPDGFFRQHTSKPASQLRLLHYLQNNCSASDATVNMGAHTDYECFTILHSSTPALQILDLDSKWVDAQPIENTFYFNIGDMLEVWTGGLLVATPHRVANSGDERFSLPYFAATDYHTVVTPAECPAYANRQKEYAPVVAGSHLLSQLLRDFPYLRKRFEAGLLQMPELRPGPNPYESRIVHSGI